MTKDFLSILDPLSPTKLLAAFIQGGFFSQEEVRRKRWQDGMNACAQYDDLKAGKCCSKGKLMDDYYTKRATNICRKFVNIYFLADDSVVCVANCLVQREASNIQKNSSCSDRAANRLGSHFACYFQCGFIPSRGLPDDGVRIGVTSLLPGAINSVLN